MQLRKASLEDKTELKQICISGYSICFADYWNANGLEWYLNEQFGDQKLKTDLANKNIDYYIIYDTKDLIGFVKVNSNPNPTFPTQVTTELEKMYVLPEFKGQGIGRKVLTEVINIIQKRGSRMFFLDVLDTNKSAIEFYKKLGFNFLHSSRLNLPYFKDHLRGINRMIMELA